MPSGKGNSDPSSSDDDHITGLSFRALRPTNNHRRPKTTANSPIHKAFPRAPDPERKRRTRPSKSQTKPLEVISHFSLFLAGSRKDPITSTIPVRKDHKIIKTTSVLVATSGHNILPIPGPKKVKTPAKIPTTPSITGLKLESKPKIWTMNPGIEFEIILVIICIKTPVAAPEKQPISNPIKDPQI
jgi:hypothetical protein